jgi:CRISPR-associated protein Cas2
MFTIVSYDVVDDKRRTKVLKLLKGYGTHVQYSVFECYLNQHQFAKLRRELRALIDLSTDSVRCYRLDSVAAERTQIIGIGQVTTDAPYYLVAKKVIASLVCYSSSQIRTSGLPGGGSGGGRKKPVPPR